MGKAERVTRVDAALFEAAAAEGSRQSRSARQQLEHWARLGAALSAQMDSPANRVRLALDGKVAQRDLTLDEARQFDAAVAVRLEDTLTHADFASAPLPDFTAAAPNPHRVLIEMTGQAARTPGAHPRDQLREALARLQELLDAEDRPRREPGPGG